jgi:hypothetical protein
MQPFGHDQLLQTWALASVLGLIPAVIAHRKGRSFGLWWIYGTMLFIVALFHALLIKPPAPPIQAMEQPPLQPPETSLPEGTKPCCSCGQLIDAASTKCPVCKGIQPS